MIKIIDSLYLTEKGCSIKKRNYHPVHIRQGDIDGACAVYSLMMNLLILKTISRVQIEDVYDNIKKSPETEKLFHEFFDKHGMIRGGFYFDQLTKLVNRVYGEVVTAQYSNINDNFRETDFCELVKTAIDDNIPIILGMDFKTGGGHAVLAIGYEYDEDGIFNVFCLDPGYECNPTSYWNMVIALNLFSGKFKHQCLTNNSYNCPAVYISDAILITKNKKK